MENLKTEISQVRKDLGLRSEPFGLETAKIGNSNRRIWWTGRTLNDDNVHMTDIMQLPFALQNPLMIYPGTMYIDRKKATLRSAWQGIRNVKDSVKRDKETRRIIEHAGGRTQLYYTLGEHDFVAILDFPRRSGSIPQLPRILQKHFTYRARV